MPPSISASPGTPTFASGRRGYSLLQVLTVIAIIAILLALLIPGIVRAQHASRQVACLSHLRQIGVAFRLYDHNNGCLPYPAYTEVPWERSLALYSGTDVFQCPADGELAPATGSSYDWRDTGIPKTTLAGRAMREAVRPSVILAFDALPDWHQKGMINALVVEGTVHT